MECTLYHAIFMRLHIHVEDRVRISWIHVKRTDFIAGNPELRKKCSAHASFMRANLIRISISDDGVFTENEPKLLLGGIMLGCAKSDYFLVGSSQSVSWY